MKILAISGSLRAGSSNSALIAAAQSLVSQDTKLEIYDDLAVLPHFNPELDIEPAPETVHRFRSRLLSADAVLISTPEYAFGMPGSLKNALDWVVSSGEFAGKPTAVVSASPLASGGDKALASLIQTLKVMSAVIGDTGMLSVPFVRSKFDSSGALVDPDTIKALRLLLNSISA